MNERDDADPDFAAAVTGARPLAQKKARVEPQKNKAPTASRGQVAAAVDPAHPGRADEPFRLTVGEDGRAEGLAPSVSFDLLQRLRRGEFAHRRQLDLHGLTRDSARRTVERFVSESRSASERCVLIVTGRGRGSADGEPVLRQSLPQWLSTSPARAHVLAFCTALPLDGGLGAFYVLLRKPAK